MVAGGSLAYLGVPIDVLVSLGLQAGERHNGGSASPLTLKGFRVGDVASDSD